MSRHPEVKWAQRVDKVFITVQLPDAQNAKVNLEPEGVFKFTASAGSENNSYELTLELFDKVDVEESKINIGVRSIFCILEKAEKVWWKKLLRGDSKLPHYVKVDWDKWVDEDEADGEGGNVDTGGMDFSNFNMGDMGGMGGMGGMPGMGGMGGMPGMGGMGGMPDMGGMGGMPGMGGLPGMGGFPGMGGMGGIPGMGEFDDSDEEDDEVVKPDGAKQTLKTDEPGSNVEEKKESAAST